MSPLVPRLRMVIVALMMTTCLPKGVAECITNPMDKINQQAREQYQTTDEVLHALKKSSPTQYQKLLRIYGIYRACVDGGTGRWTDNVKTQGSSGCPYCRNGIEEVDKAVKTRPKWPKGQSSTSCVQNKFCHVSLRGCYYYGPKPSEEECRNLGWYGNGRDSNDCHGDRHDRYGYNCDSCRERDSVRTNHCPVMCGLCEPPCGNVSCGNVAILDHVSCTGSCNPYLAVYTGKHCDNLNCSLVKRDRDLCKDSGENCDDDLIYYFYFLTYYLE